MGAAKFFLFKTSNLGFDYTPAVNIAGNQLWRRPLGSNDPTGKYMGTVEAQGHFRDRRIANRGQFEWQWVVVGLNGASRESGWFS